MNQSKFSLADVLTVLAALAFGFVCFLSANFFTLGNTQQSIIMSIIIAVLLGGLALVAKLLKRTSRSFKTCFICEMIMLVLFAGFAVVFAIAPFSHYFAISDRKTEIQSKLTASITQAENMFTEYEKYAGTREGLYKKRLQSVVAAKQVNPSEYAAYGFESNGVSDEKQIENKMFTVHADLFPSNFTAMKRVDSIWLVKSRNIVKNWKPIGIVGVVNDVEQNTNEWLEQLIKLSSVRETEEQSEDFSYALSFDDLKEDFETLGDPTPLSLGLAVSAYAIMLLSYFVTKRHSKFPGIRILFSAGMTVDNEL
ncbi:MAG: hypothetical protein LBF59_02765 [Prevotellaceae bacterium]|jgi:F0F1-type ATP synthase membrane subunit b/b'|nr:hypothetical protein [Prevotellaceae bacterium]